MRFVYEGTKYEVEPHRLTFKEARDFEKASGHTMADMAKAGGVEDIGTVQALFWIAMRREDKAIRFSDLDDMNMADFEQLPDDDEPAEEGETDPTQPAVDGGEASTPSG